jgi:plasmid stabilization system protein ParE
VNRRVVFRPEAENEVLETRRWYEERHEGLGAEFASAVDAIVERIVTSPLAFPCAHGETRRAVLRRFPYAIYFRILADGAIVVLALHGRQHPLRWETRS